MILKIFAETSYLHKFILSIHIHDFLKFGYFGWILTGSTAVITLKVLCCSKSMEKIK